LRKEAQIMDVKYEAMSESGPQIVYIRSVAVADLPSELREQVGEVTTVYSLNNSEGEQLALVRDRPQAFVLARMHDYLPVSVH
jgi:hypothetical protein